MTIVIFEKNLLFLNFLQNVQFIKHFEYFTGFLFLELNNFNTLTKNVDPRSVKFYSRKLILVDKYLSQKFEVGKLLH